jgi:glyoxylase-like metal-dependent hydrolase (beta-lactamase superfamily II)
MAAVVGILMMAVVLGTAERARAEQDSKPVSPGGSRGGAPAAKLSPGSKLDVLHVQRNVYMVAGAGGNIAVQVGPEGVLVVDAGLAEMSDQVLAAIRTLSDQPIRWILNTHLHPDHTGGNRALSEAGSTVGGNPATIASHVNVLDRMTQAKIATEASPSNTFYGESKDFSFNDEAVILYHVPDAHTDGDSLVFFRSSDVVVAGDLIDTTRFPVIDVINGGGVQGLIEGLNRILALAVPKHQQEGGTYVIPGHGRVLDEADVLEYRDMVVIVRDRIQALITKGQTLAQVKAAKPTLDYDRWWGADKGPWTTDMFVEAVYRSLTKK